MIGSDIEVKVLDLKDNQVKLGIVAPRHIAVHRHEVYKAIQAENAQAAAADVPAADLSNIPKLFPR